MRDAAGATSAADPENHTGSLKAAELDDGVPTIVIPTSDASEEFGHQGRQDDRQDAPPSLY